MDRSILEKEERIKNFSQSHQELQEESKISGKKWRIKNANFKDWKKTHQSLPKAKTNLKSEGTGVDLNHYALVLNGKAVNLRALRVLLQSNVSLGVSRGFPGSSDGKNAAYKAGDLGSIPGSGRSPGGRNGYHFSTLAWRIPWTEEPGGLESMGSQRIGHGWQTNTNTGDQLVVYKVSRSCQPKTQTEKFTFKTNSDVFVLQILRRRIIRR